MITGIDIITTDNIVEFEHEIDKRIRTSNVKDIKFCVNPIIKASGYASHSSGNQYYAMVIYEDRGE